MEVLDDSYVGSDSSHYVHASRGRRFGHFLIDLVLMSTVGSFVGAFDKVEQYDVQSYGYSWEANWKFYILYVAYYFVCEAFLKGQTIGKMATKTRVLNLDGSEPEPKTILLRAISRLVPFSGISIFWGSHGGWWDRWTNTMVIDEKKSSL